MLTAFLKTEKWIFLKENKIFKKRKENYENNKS